MIKIWKKYLINALKLFLGISKNTNYFKLKIIIFFISINVLFYWIAMFVAFPELTVTLKIASLPEPDVVIFPKTTLFDKSIR